MRYAVELAALAAVAVAQTSTIINDPNDPLIRTVYYSVCPTAATTTTTLANTLTYCPGGTACNGAVITAGPNPNHASTSTVLQLTVTGTDGKVTEVNEYYTTYDAPCTAGPGMCHAIYPITETCPCNGGSSLLPGFTTSVHVCGCGANGESMTMTQTLPCSTGPYASVTPTMGSGSAASASAAAAAAAAAGGNGAGAMASAGAAAGVSAGSSGSGAPGSGAPGSGSPAAANAQAGAGAGASAGPAGSNAAASAGANAQAGAGSNGAAPGAGQGGMGNNMQPSAGMPGAAGSNGNGTISPFPGTADRTILASSTLFVALVGSLAWLL